MSIIKGKLRNYPVYLIWKLANLKNDHHLSLPMIHLLYILLGNRINGLSVDLIKRGACVSSSCMVAELDSFEDKYILGKQIDGKEPIFRCAELSTHIQYVCKFPSMNQIINHLPAEVAVHEVLNDTSEPEKSLFVEMHEYFIVDRIFSQLPAAKRESKKQYVEVIKFYDGNWYNGAKYVRRILERSEQDVVKILKQIVSGIKYLYKLGFYHLDIKRNDLSNDLCSRKFFG